MKLKTLSESEGLFGLPIVAETVGSLVQIRPAAIFLAEKLTVLEPGSKDTAFWPDDLACGPNDARFGREHCSLRTGNVSTFPIVDGPPSKCAAIFVN